MTTNTSNVPTTAAAPASGTQPFQSPSLYVGDLNPDVTEVF